MNAMISNKDQIVKAFTTQQSPSLNQSLCGQKPFAKKEIPDNGRQDFSDNENLHHESLMREMLYFDRF